MFEKNNLFFAFSGAITEKELLTSRELYGWQYAIKIEEPKEAELTLEQRMFNIEQEIKSFRKLWKQQ